MNYEKKKYKKALDRAKDMLSYKEVSKEDMESKYQSFGLFIPKGGECDFYWKTNEKVNHNDNDNEND